MKHATEAALRPIEPLERRPGTFYVRGRAFLHFHEDPAGLFADLKRAGDWERFAVNDAAERDGLLHAVTGFVSGVP
jgi:hypothetical protein